jgi:ParB family chromosome partitioning protein
MTPLNVRTAATAEIEGAAIAIRSVNSRLIEMGNLTAGHARALVATDSPTELADKIIKLGLSVREAEGLARDAAPGRKPKSKPEKDADTKALERTVSEAIGLKLPQGDAGGLITQRY